MNALKGGQNHLGTKNMGVRVVVEEIPIAEWFGDRFVSAEGA